LARSGAASFCNSGERAQCAVDRHVVTRLEALRRISRDVNAQRAAMKKLQFLVGEWSGEASALRGPGQFPRRPAGNVIVPRGLFRVIEIRLVLRLG
jgi:hypothetical protein